MPLLALLLLVPVLAEIAMFIVVGHWIGVAATLLLFIAIGIAGTILLKRQGIRALTEMQAALARGQPPAEPVAHAALLVLAGLLLVFPGFLSDLLALPLLIPPVRSALIRWVSGRAQARGGFTVWPGGRGRDTVIDADYTEVNPDETSPGRRDPAMPKIEDSRWGGNDQGNPPGAPPRPPPRPL